MQRACIFTMAGGLAVTALTTTGCLLFEKIGTHF